MKPGWKTTEFWLSVVAVVGGLLLGGDVVPAEGEVGQIVGAVVGALTAAGYGLGRAWVKSADAKRAREEE